MKPCKYIGPITIELKPYEYYKFSLEPDITHNDDEYMIYNQNNIPIYFITKKIFKKYFIDIQQERKLKLNQLKKTSNE